MLRVSGSPRQPEVEARTRTRATPKKGATPGLGTYPFSNLVPVAPRRPGVGRGAWGVAPFPLVYFAVQPDC